MTLSKVCPIKSRAARMSEQQLQATLLRTCAEAMQRYAGNTNGQAPERIIQCYVWDKVVSLGSRTSFHHSMLLRTSASVTMSVIGSIGDGSKPRPR
jgi:hypothetical protein